MRIQFINMYYPDVFKKYSSKYNIFRDLYEKDLSGLEIRSINSKLAHRIKKIVLNNKEICYITDDNMGKNNDLLIIGSYSIFKELAKEIIAIGNEDLGFKISHVIKNITDYENSEFKVKDKRFPLNKAYVMGILNVTPDSFSDGGKYYSKEAAVEHGIKLLEEGASILDIGGESTRPGADSISQEEELKRVIPVIEEVLKHRPDALISIDTTKSTVAGEALSKGASMVNDISSLSDPDMATVVNKYKSPLILMHMKGIPKNMQDNPNYVDVVSEIYDYLIDKCDSAKKSGIKNLIVDPGIGFGKRVYDNYEIIKRLNEFKGIGHPILLGASRKSFLGKPLDLETDNREDPTLISETIAIKNGARIIRTHNVKKTIFAAKINDFIENPESLNNV